MQKDELVFYVKLHVKADCIQEWKAAVLSVIEAMSRESTFIACNLHQDAHDETLFTLYERWAEDSVESFMANQMKPYRVAYEAMLPALLERPREAQVLRMLGRW
jgi:quinol monooxygenase YgiN